MSADARKPKKSKVDPNESREQKFKRLAQNRGKKLTHQMVLLSNLGGSYAYKIDPELAEELLEEFTASLDDLKASWREAIAKTKPVSQASDSSDETEDEPSVVVSSAE
jgi:hypothetical protein